MKGSRLTRAVAAWLGLTLAVTGASVVARLLSGPHGLRLAAVQPDEVTTLRVSAVDLRDLRLRPSLARASRLAWDGYWRVPSDGRYKLIAQGAGPVTVSVDGQPVLSGQSEGRLRGRVALTAGVHSLTVGYEAPGGPDRLRLRWSRDEEPLRDFEPDTLFVSAPSAADLAWSRVASVLAVLVRVLWVSTLVAAIVLAALGYGPAWARRAAVIALPLLVVLCAAALRFDALVGRYSWEGPPWAIAAQRVVERWRPGGEGWNPEYETSGGDPYHYVTRARAMRGFYDADAREPLFPALTRVLLARLDDRILAVHVASAACSTLLVLATYLLGAAAFSRAAGLVAALALAVDRDALWWSVEGFRDDAFALFVVLSALALVHLLRRPTVTAAVLAGVAGAAACLTRITSVSFLLPACLLLLLPRDERADDRRCGVAVALAVLAALVAPFLISCAIAYGDPLYAVNVHTKFYRSRSGLAFQQSMSWLDYLRAGSPLGQQVSTGLRGLTTYPFGNKWHGLDYFLPWLALPLAAAAVAGLVLFLRSWPGRLLLVVLFASLLPYAFTWTIPGGAEWRFTMHAYPFYLVAAGLALTNDVGWARRALAAPRASTTA
jgi:hypothetical protein